MFFILIINSLQSGKFHIIKLPDSNHEPYFLAQISCGFPCEWVSDLVPYSF